jgi:uncharacterized protein YcfJ
LFKSCILPILFFNFKIKMANTHHRKKHKEHLRQYQHSHDGASSKGKKGKVSGTIAVIGAILGIAIGYFATDGALIWVAFGAIAGGLAGYLVGHYFEKEETGN